MKYKLLCLALCLLLIFSCLPAQAAFNNFYLRTRYGQLVSYENFPYCYAIDVYSGFYMYSDDQLNALWENYDNNDDDDDEIYDFRYWISPDRTYEFLIQVKEQTYASFEEEIAHAPYFIDNMMDDLRAAGFEDIRQLHPGILRDTPEGQMLETAYSVGYVKDGASTQITVVYYDCYFEDIEYIFEVTAYNGDYETAQYLLDQMVQTLDITYPEGNR